MIIVIVIMIVIIIIVITIITIIIVIIIVIAILVIIVMIVVLRITMTCSKFFSVTSITMMSTFCKEHKKLFTLLDLCVSSLRRGHANLLCIVPILTDDPRRKSTMMSTFWFADKLGSTLMGPLQM